MRDEIDRSAIAPLLPFVAAFEGFGPKRPFGGSGRPDDASNALIQRFVETLEAHGWLYAEYDFDEAERYRFRPHLLAEADLAACRRMLTWCQRLDYWTDGSDRRAWQELIDDGVLPALLRRLERLYAQRAA